MHGLAPDHPVCWANKASRAIFDRSTVGQYWLIQYKEKWDKLLQFCEKLLKLRVKFCDRWRICIMFRKILVYPKKNF
jgi:hypothetical protein